MQRRKIAAIGISPRNMSRDDRRLLSFRKRGGSAAVGCVHATTQKFTCMKVLSSTAFPVSKPFQ